MQHFLNVTETFVPRNSLIWSRRHQINIKISLLLICPCTWNTTIFFFFKTHKSNVSGKLKDHIVNWFEISSSTESKEKSINAGQDQYESVTRNPKSRPSLPQLSQVGSAENWHQFVDCFALDLKDSMSQFIVISMYLQLMRCLFYLCTPYTEVI